MTNPGQEAELARRLRETSQEIQALNYNVDSLALMQKTHLLLDEAASALSRAHGVDLGKRVAELTESLSGALAHIDVLEQQVYASRAVPDYVRARAEAMERAASYHDEAAQECDRIAAVNMNNELGPDCVTRAQDHRVDADAIRALKDKP